MKNEMDLELLNFWIENLDFYIRDNTLKMRLYVPYFRNYIMELSSNKKDILDFFGFDTNIDYDALKEKDVFVYLCSSKKLCHTKLRLCSIKGPFPKNKQHSKFNQYLQTNYFVNDVFRIPQEMSSSIKWSKEAISFFKKDKEYDMYMAQYNMFLKLKLCFNKLTISNAHRPIFNAFLMLYGVKNVINGHCFKT